MSGFSGGAAGATSGGGFTLGATGAAGAGSFTPVRLTEGFPPGLLLRAGGCFLFLFQDGSAWELRWGFYSGTVITRPTNGFVASSTGSALTLSAAATAGVVQAAGFAGRLGAEHLTTITPRIGSTALDAAGVASGTGFVTTGTPASISLADTNLLTREPLAGFNSATTANASAGYYGGNGDTLRNAGFHLAVRFGAAQLPTGPRLYVGLDSAAADLTGDPSAQTNMAAFAKDSADTNIQLMSNDGAGAATKRDTSIALAINRLYEVNLWSDPAGTIIHGLLIDYVNQALFYGEISTDLPVAGQTLVQRCQGALAATTGTAFNFRLGSFYLRSGA